MAVACLTIPHFALRVGILTHPEHDGRPLVLSDPHHGRPVVLDATPEARRRGVRPGLSLREATALCPEAVVLEPDPAAEHAILQRITAALDDVSPLVEPPGADAGSAHGSAHGTWYIDLTGLGGHYASARDAGLHMLRLVEPALRPRMGIAVGKFAARVAAHQSEAGSIALIAPSRTTHALAGAPVELLPLSADTRHQLHLLGIETLGQFAALPRPRVAARFGPAGRFAWDLIRGDADDPVRPPVRDLTVSEHTDLPAPVTTWDVLMVAIRQLAQRAFRAPELRHRHAREITIRAGMEYGRSWQRSLIFKEPYGLERLIRAVMLRLQNLEMPGPIERLTLDIHGIVPTTAHQVLLPALRPRQMASLTDAIAMLKQRYGPSPLFRIVEVEPWSRIPERRHALVSFDP